MEKHEESLNGTPRLRQVCSLTPHQLRGALYSCLRPLIMGIMPLSAAQKQTNFTSLLHFVLFVLATLSSGAAHKHGHGCIHNNVALRVPLISAQRYERDRRQQSWESIRITFDFNGIDSSLPAAQRTYITKLITDAGDWLRASLMVKRVLGNLKFEDFAGTDKNCGEVNLAAFKYTKYISTGVAADVVIFVLAQVASDCATGDVLAYATHCRQDQYDRPTFGYIQMCPQQMAVKTIQAEQDEDFHTAVHEITHILGYSSSLFPFFRDINGAPYTARCGDPSTHPTSWLPPGVFAYTEGTKGTGNPANKQYAEAWCCDSSTIGWPPWKCQYEYWEFQVADTVLKVQTVGGDLDRVGNTSRMLVTPGLVSVARQHFGCPTLAGVELEDDGGEGSAGSHWEERQMMSEYMGAAPSGFRNVKSNLTLALLQDSGWYKVDYAAADILRWGYRQGCHFLNSCGSQSSIGWCSMQSNLQCSFDRSGIGECTKSGKYMDGCPVTRNFGRTCNSFWQEPKGLYGGSCGGKDCTGGTFSSASACFESSLFSSAYVRSSEIRKPVSCYDYACIPTNTFTLDGTPVFQLKIKDPTGVWRNCGRRQEFTGIAEFTGSLVCPDDWTILCAQTKVLATSTTPTTTTPKPTTARSCTSNSDSPPQSSAQAACTCNAGYGGDAGTGNCTACAAGKYKTQVVNRNCSDCSAGKYGTATGQTAEASCTACTAKSDSLPQSSARAACTCNAGYGGDAGTGNCTACLAGQYKTQAGNRNCSDCGAGKYGSATGQTAEASCTVCGAGKYRVETGGSAEASCTACDAGKYGVDAGQTADSTFSSSVCVDCAAGKYSEASAATTCVGCASGMYSDALKATSCVECASGKVSGTSATTCQLPVFVRVSLSLPMTREDFNEDRQTNFKQAMANVAVVSITHVSLDKIEPIARRVTSIRVDVSVAMTGVSSAEALHQSMTLERVNAELSKVGLPEATMLELSKVGLPNDTMLATVKTVGGNTGAGVEETPRPVIGTVVGALIVCFILARECY